MKRKVDYEKRLRSEIDHWTRHASVAERVWNWEGAIGRERFERRLRFLAGDLQRGMRCLELGCGTGLFTKGLAATGAEVTAIDITPDLLIKARQRVHEAKLLERDACNTGFKDASFDAVVGSSVLHHLDIGQALPEIRRVLKPGGELRFTEPNYLNPHIFLERKVEFIRVRLAVSKYETAFVRWELADRLRREGFCGIRVLPFDFIYPYLPAQALNPMRSAGAFLESVPLVREFAGSLRIAARKPEA